MDPGATTTDRAVIDARSPVLVINSGSSSLKYELIVARSARRLAVGSVERIGEGGSVLVHRGTSGPPVLTEADVADHRGAIEAMLDAFVDHGPSLDRLLAVGHRVVTAGDAYTAAVVIDDDVCSRIESCAPLAPLHNPANLIGIEVARRAFTEVPHVAVFDTAFFAELPPAAATYAIDRATAARHDLRRYGAHGTSHRYVTARVRGLLGAAGSRRLIVLHLGNGASAAAVLDGRPVETSMGMTPLEGLVMGTRCGDIDPAIPTYLQSHAGMSTEEVDELLNHRSGVLGLSGHRDMRDLHRSVAAGDAAARAALEVYLHRLRKYIGAYVAVLGGLDALAFTAGVGEHDAVVRAGALEGLGFLGLSIDVALNEAADGTEAVISPPGAQVSVLVVPTDEELEIARQVAELVT